MRKFQFHKPFKITNTRLHKEYLNTPTNFNYERGCSYVTKYGIVLISELKWEYNGGFHCFTDFSTIMNGYKHSATLEEAKLSDRQLKWLATNFIKRVVLLVENPIEYIRKYNIIEEIK